MGEGLQKLLKYASRCTISLDQTGVDDVLAAKSMAQLTVTWDGGSATFVVDDEYDDTRKDVPALRLALIRLTIGDMAEAGSSARWAHTLNWTGAAEDVDAYYQNNLAAYERLRTALGNIPDVITSYDWQLNAGDAAALRAL